MITEALVTPAQDTEIGETSELFPRTEQLFKKGCEQTSLIDSEEGAAAAVFQRVAALCALL